MIEVGKAQTVVDAADRLKSAEREYAAAKRNLSALYAEVWTGDTRAKLPLTGQQCFELLRKKVRLAKVALTEAQS